MDNINQDIFSSNQAFVKYASSWLLGISLPFLLLGISCQFFSWAYCDLQLVPLFGGMTRFRPEFTTIALPLAMLIISMSLKMYTYFGWMISLILMTCLDTLFVSLAMVLSNNLDKAKAFAIADQKVIDGTNPEVVSTTIARFQESIVINYALAIVCTGAVIFLILPSVRKLYWKAFE